MCYVRNGTSAKYRYYDCLNSVAQLIIQQLFVELRHMSLTNSRWTVIIIFVIIVVIADHHHQKSAVTPKKKRQKATSCEWPACMWHWLSNIKQEYPNFSGIASFCFCSYHRSSSQSSDRSLVASFRRTCKCSELRYNGQPSSDRRRKWR